MIPDHQNHNLSRIYLWGFMGSGKTSIGKELAQRLGYEFLDLDIMMESIEKMRVSEIFSQKGEGYFRKLEQETLKQVAGSKDKIVISTGGGTPCYYDNAELMNNTGVTIYLNVSPKSLKKRLKADEINSRPLLTNLTWMEIMDLYQSRQEFYESAQIKVSNDQDVTYCLQRIMDEIDKIGGVSTV